MRTLTYCSLLTLFAILISGCAPRVSTQISPSFADARTLISTDRKHQVPIQLYYFPSSLKNNYKLKCLKNDAVKSPLFRSFSREFYLAIRDDLHYVKLYHPYATKAFLQGYLKKLYFDVGGFDQGYWYIKMNFHGKPNVGKEVPPFTVTDKHYFTLDPDDPNACKQIANAFPSAVRHFMKKLYNTKSFKKIITDQTVSHEND